MASGDTPAVKNHGHLVILLHIRSACDYLDRFFLPYINLAYTKMIRILMRYDRADLPYHYLFKIL